MAYDLVATVERWIGLSTDTKPTPGYVGSEFYEYDTGRTYVYTQGAWQIKPIAIYNVQGGAYTIQDLMDEHLAQLDLARSPQSGDTVMDGSEQTLYEESDTHPFVFYGGRIDWTGLNSGGGEDTTINCYIKIESGGTYRVFDTVVYLAAGLPSPIITNHPNDANDALRSPLAVHNVYGIKVTATQAAIGGGWNTLACEWFDSKRGG